MFAIMGDVIEKTRAMDASLRWHDGYGVGSGRS